MTALIPEGKSRLLLVEGKEDQEFFIQLGYHLGFTSESPLHILQYEGKDKLAGFLYQLIQNPNFKQVSQIGIVRDADYGTDAFQSVQSALERANQYSKKQPLPVPQIPMQPAEGRPRISALILPADAEGMLEDLVMNALKEDTIMPCVDDFFICLDRKAAIVQERLPKARVRVFITGKNMDAQATISDDASKLYLSDIYHMSWWDNELWEHDGFKDAKAFLRQLAVD